MTEPQFVISKIKDERYLLTIKENHVTLERHELRHLIQTIDNEI